MANQNADIDISKFLDDWYSEIHQNPNSIFRIALTSEILLGFITNNSVSSKKNIPIFNYRNSRNFWWSFKKTFWFLLWLIKWIIFLTKIKRSRIVIAAIGSNLNSTQEYFKQLLEIAKKNDCIIVLMNLVESFNLLNKGRLFYYPRFLYKKKSFNSNIKHTKIIDELIDDIQRVAEKNNLAITVDKTQLIKSLKNLIKDYNSFTYLTDSISNPKKIAGSILDYDYTYNKYLYCTVSKFKSIKTIAIDTSLTIYKHFYKKVFSDYHLVWGKYKQELLLNHNNINPSNITITGKAGIIEHINTNKGVIKDLWIYIAQAYSAPSMFTSGRNFISLEANLKKLVDFQKSNYPDDNFELKLHPADNPMHFNISINKSVNTPISKLLERAKIIFVEDTTLAVELLGYCYPLVYVLDKYGNDNIGLVNDGLIPGIIITERFENVIEQVLNYKNSIDPVKRKNALNYYFGNYNETNFYTTLNTLLFPDE